MTPAAPTFTGLPRELLHRIMLAADQGSRMNCMRSCWALHRAAKEPGVWDSITLYDVDATAVDFVRDNRCSRVLLAGAQPDDVSWFLHRLADVAHEQLQHLDIELGAVERLPQDLLSAVGRHPRLRSLRLVVKECARPAELCFAWQEAAALGELERLTVAELDEDKNVSLWFDDTQAHFRSLREVHLEVACSDIATGLPHLPALRSLVYRSDPDGDEDYGDLSMAGADLDRLEIDVSDFTDYPTLWDQLRRARVRSLVLNVHDHTDITHVGPALESLELRMAGELSRVHIDFPTFSARHPRLKRLATSAAPWLEDEADHGHHPHKLCLRGVEDQKTCFRFLGLIDFAQHPLTELSIMR
jgi:hypothetical protein